MKKFITTITALMLTVFLAFAFNGCKPGPDPDDPEDNMPTPEDNMPTKEGVYLGIIGFNQTLTVKNISLLDKSSYPSFKNFISDLDMYIGTGLYYADYNAIEKLKSYGEPPKLANVALVTFTDGLDNVSTDNDKSINPLEYYTDIEYYSALNNMIENDSIHGKSISAYTIGIKGNDVDDYDLFYNNLNKLASSKENVYEASDMNEVLEYFAEIAESLNSKTTTTKLKLQIPGGYNDGTKIRFTFDNVNSADNSSKYIECTYTRTSSGRTLENITYHGLKNGETVLNSVAKIGLYYEFEFGNLTFDDGNIVNLSDVSRLKLWKEISTGWQRDGEFTPENSSDVIEEKSSALIMLVLDCTSSLGNDFSNMKQGAIKFVETLVNSGGNSGGNSGEPETPEEPEEPETPEQPEEPENPEQPEDPENPEQPEDPENPENPEQPEQPENPENPEEPEVPEQPVVTTAEVTGITCYTAVSGGEVTFDGNVTVTARGICWSTSQTPTIEDNKTTDGSGVGGFTSNLSNLEHNTTYYVRAYATNEVGTAYGEEVTFTTLLDPANGHEYVDLGLSVKWATCNVGANSPEEYGDYFAWGETSTKETYDYDNCPTYRLSTSQLKSQGYIDSEGNLTPQYDAATANWGGDWRMPTYDELNELRNSCTWTWTTQNGVNGYNVEGPSGASIFLPAAGYRVGSSLDGAGGWGYYWSSAPNEYFDGRACRLYFDSANHLMGIDFRDNGLSVRPVLE